MSESDIWREIRELRAQLEALTHYKTDLLAQQVSELKHLAAVLEESQSKTEAIAEEIATLVEDGE